MRCQKCNEDLPEPEIHTSHDVPRYLFPNKNDADRWGRHNLCKKCHDIYEKLAFWSAVNWLPEETKQKCRLKVREFADSYFKRGEGDATTD